MVKDEKEFLLSPMQEGMLFHEMMCQDEDIYYNQITFDIYGDMYVALFERSIQILVNSHEVLRTKFLYKDRERPKQVILDDKIQKVSFYDLSRKSEDEKELFINNKLIEDRKKRVALENGELMRIHLFCISEGHYKVIWGCHHIILDGWCMSLLIKELFSIYNRIASGNSEPLEEVPYSSYLKWLETYDRSSVEKYWHDYLKDPIEVFDFPRKSKTSLKKKINVHNLVIKKELLDEVKKIAAKAHVTVNTIVQALWGLLLCKYSNENRAIWGCVTSGRSAPIKDIQKVIGLFINTMPLSVTYENDLSLIEQLKKVNMDIFKAELNGTIQISKLKNEGKQLFNHIFAFENLEISEMLDGIDVCGFKLKNPKFYDHTNYDLAVKVDPTNKLVMNFEYNEFAFEEKTILNIATSYEYLMKQFINNPNMTIKEYSILNEEQIESIETNLNSNRNNNYTLNTIQQHFEEIANKYSSKEAIIFNDERITYENLLKQSKSIAAYLIDMGVKRGDIVGVSAESSIDTIKCILGILFARGCYLPLDEKLPKKRLITYIKNANLKIILSDNMSEYSGIKTIKVVNKDIKSTKELKKINYDYDDICYLIYTSGTTGNPKGVLVSNSALERFSSDKEGNISGIDSDVVSQIASLSFDASIYEIFTCLLTGGTLVIASENDKADSLALIEFLIKNKITRCFLTTQLFNMLTCEDPYCFKNIRVLVTGGERASAKHFYKAAKACKETRFINAYGPTEIVSISSAYEFNIEEKLDNIPIGKPEASRSYYVLDKNMHMVPQGMIGELYISGTIASGYLNQEELTNERFVINPFNKNEKLYKTGDIVSWTLDNKLIYINRNDDQVKIRGFRIETGEIEKALSNCEGVKNSFVLIKQDDKKNWNIYGYFTSEKKLEIDDVISSLKMVLPSYMIPTGLMQLDNLPLNKNGKVDKNKLPDIKNSAINEVTMPENNVQKMILDIWKKVLDNDNIGINHNFFTVGGDSIKAMQIIGLMKKQGLNGEIRLLFENPTINEFSKYVSVGNRISQEAITGNVSLMPIQKWFFNSDFDDISHFNQSILLKTKIKMKVDVLKSALDIIIKHHDALRMIYSHDNNGWTQYNRDTNAISYKLSETFNESQDNEWLNNQINTAQGELDIEKGILIRASILNDLDNQYLFIAVHHLVMDGVSFRILIRDLQEIYEDLTNNKTISLIPKTISYKDYSKHLYEAKDLTTEAVNKWEEIDISNLETIDNSKITKCLLSDRKHVNISISKDNTNCIQALCSKSNGKDISDILIGTIASEISNCFNINKYAIKVEHNGRNFENSKYDVSNTIGWFTAIYPIIVEGSCNDFDKLLDSISIEQHKLRAISSEYSLKKYHGTYGLNSIFNVEPEICFNFLGSFDNWFNSDLFDVVVSDINSNQSNKQYSNYVLEFNSLIVDGKIHLQIDYNPKFISDEMADGLSLAITNRINTICINQINNRYKPFPLSSVQMAYFLGKQDFYELGGFTTHNYIEFLTTANINKLEKVLQKIIDSQDMLRTIINSDGTQQILKEVEPFKINITDISKKDKESQEKDIVSERNRLSHKYFDISTYPLFEINGFKLNDKEHYLFISYDLMILDSASINLLIQDLAKGYFDDSVEFERLNYSYRDFIYDLLEMKKKQVYKKAKNYWLSKLDDFPESPVLPVKQDPSKIKEGHFTRRYKLFDKNQYSNLKNKAAENGMTISALLLSVYGSVLRFNSGMDKFAINLTVFNRQPFHPDIERMYGDFTSTLLIDFDYSSDNFFKESERIQKTLADALENRIYDGVEFSRELAKKFKYPKGKSMMPIVFTSLLFEQDVWQDMSKLGTVKWSIGQTPQVYIDFQVLLENGHLKIQMDWVDELFEEELMKSFFDQYCNMLSELASDSSKVSKLTLSNKQLEVRKKYNNTTKHIDSNLKLHELFKLSAKKYPDKIAIICDEDTITYKDLDYYSDKIASYLINKGLVKRAIGVFSERRIGTIINMLGILKSGSYYVPISPDYPKERVNYIKDQSKIDVILYSEDYKDIKAENINKYPEVNINDTAYIIYTSGSTGNPKGVEISHKAASNTILDINNRFGISKDDKTLGLSSMCFDLSVYDIFGTFTAAATLVMVTDIYAVEKTVAIVEKHSITIWNSVPGLLQMYMDIRNKNQGKSLKTIMMSGDWIPLTLAESLLKSLPNASIYSLGGATEAAIWSIYYPIKEIKKNWSSIPYGMPLENQQIYILDSNLNDCPDNVRGEICIGGDGVAKGYVSLIDKTNESFVNHNKYGRIYKTGDYGIFRPDGYVEFCGRIDGQVKLQGFRIELGEIENVLLNCDNVKNAIALVVERSNGTRQIIGFVQWINDNDIHMKETLKEVSKHLPSYMIPATLKTIKTIPLTPNGKVNRKLLLSMISDEVEDKKLTKPENETEEKLLDIWKRVLKLNNAGTEDDFFESGGDSLKAMLLLNTIKKEMHFEELLLTDILRNPTIKSLANSLNNNIHKITRLLGANKDKSPIYFVHGGNGSSDSYMNIVNDLNSQFSCYGIDYIGKASLEPNKISISKLATKYAQAICDEHDINERIILVGWCIGGTICYEIAKILEEKGYRNLKIIMLDTQEPGINQEYSYDVNSEVSYIKSKLHNLPLTFLKDKDNIHDIWDQVYKKLSESPLVEDRFKKSFIKETKNLLTDPNNLTSYEMLLLNNLFRSFVDAVEKVSLTGKLKYAKPIYIHAINQSSAKEPIKWQDYFENKLDIKKINTTHFELLDNTNASLCAKIIGED